PYYLVNGRIGTAPQVTDARAGQRLRLRLINAGGDTAFRVALGGHQLTVTHTDGFPVQPFTGDAILIGMGERVDILVTLGDGVFPLVSVAEGKDGAGLALIRTGAGAAPGPDIRPPELAGRIVTVRDLRAADDVLIADGRPDRTHELLLEGGMAGGYQWTINGHTFDRAEPLSVRAGETVRLRFSNRSMMFHPMHVHGHTFQVRNDQGDGPRKDTVIVRPMETVVADLVADNPGQWLTHCHNIYHAESGMMTTLSYVK
ncbi:MAG: multicopper oxidase domain-containing protein, partial [Geodermatophilaceae bacterium]|nr:multicopper oxidase domain-containing protein [Geodermatophilaceae bacterium]